MIGKYKRTSPPKTSLYINTKKDLFELVPDPLRTKIQREVYESFLKDPAYLVCVWINKDLEKHVTYSIDIRDLGRYEAMGGGVKFSNMREWYNHNYTRRV